MYLLLLLLLLLPFHDFLPVNLGRQVVTLGPDLQTFLRLSYLYCKIIVT